VTPATPRFPALLQEFFQRHLLSERDASAHTIASYRDTFQLLLRYADKRTGRTPSALTLDDLDACGVPEPGSQLRIRPMCTRTELGTPGPYTIRTYRIFTAFWPSDDTRAEYPR
jgi:hypothetical protein